MTTPAHQVNFGVKTRQMGLSYKDILATWGQAGFSTCSSTPESAARLAAPATLSTRTPALPRSPR